MKVKETLSRMVQIMCPRDFSVHGLRRGKRFGKTDCAINARERLRLLKIENACPVCGHATREGDLCSFCERAKHDFDRAFVVFSHEEPIKRLLRAINFPGRR